MLRRSLLAALAVLLVAAAPFACSKQRSGKPRIAFVTNCRAQFWETARAGVKDAEKKFDVETSFTMPSGADDQKAKIEDILARGVDGMAISCLDPVNLAGVMDAACERTLVITHDSDSPASKRLCFIGVDNYVAGRMCGKLIKEALPQGGKVAFFVGNITQDNARRRRQGAIDELLGRSEDPSRFDEPTAEIKNDKYEVVGTFTDNVDQAKGKANAEDVITRVPDLGCMVGLFEYNPPLCLQVIRQAGKIGKIQLVGFDENEDTLKGIQDGEVVGTVVQDPYNYGFKSVEMLAALVRGDRSVLPASGVVVVPARTITKANVDAFWADLKAKTGGK